MRGRGGDRAAGIILLCQATSAAVPVSNWSVFRSHALVAAVMTLLASASLRSTPTQTERRARFFSPDLHFFSIILAAATSAGTLFLIIGPVQN
jgi:uncharacterized membrane protein